MLYKVEGKLHLWGWVDFRREIEGKLINYNTIGNLINYIIYETDKPISDEVLKEYGLIAELISEK